ncbi:MAG: ParB/RepB/Spo0J family partition protein, partial [bacterium]
RNPLEQLEVRAASGKDAARDVLNVDITKVTPNPYQPRKAFHEEELEELAQSIREKGILQPLLVRRQGEKYQIVAGERRLRAGQIAGLKTLPCLEVECSEDELLELALVENVQREDLNPIEEARAYRTLIEQLHFTQEQISERLGKGRVAIANALRLLKLPLDIQEDIEKGVLTEGHGRALLLVTTESRMRTLRHAIMSRGLSVREAERLAKLLNSQDAKKGMPTRRRDESPHLQFLREQIEVALGARVKIVERSATTGRIEIPYGSLDEFQRILERIATGVLKHSVEQAPDATKAQIKQAVAQVMGSGTAAGAGAGATAKQK